MFDLQASIQATRAAGEEVWVSGAVGSEMVGELERALGVALPSSYRRFLLDLGALSVHETLVAGIIEQDPLAATSGSLYGETVRCRAEAGLPKNLLVLQPDAEAPYCLDAESMSTGEMVVVCYQVNTRGVHRIAESFEDWLERFVFRGEA